MKKGNFSLLLLIALLFTSCASTKSVNKSTKQKKAELYYGHGTTMLLNQDYRQALKSLLSAQELDEDNPKVLNNLGMTYYFLDQKELAFDHLKQAVRLDPKHSDARVNLGSLYFENKKYKKALAQYEMVLKDLTYQHQYRTHYNIGLIYLKLGNRKEAKKQFLLSNTQNQDYCPASYELGNVFYKEYRYNSALKWFTEASKGKCYENAGPAYMQAMTLLELNDYEAARVKFQEVIERFSATRYSTMANLKLNEIKNQQILDKKEKGTYRNPEKKAKNIFNSPSF